MEGREFSAILSTARAVYVYRELCIRGCSQSTVSTVTAAAGRSTLPCADGQSPPSVRYLVDREWMVPNGWYRSTIGERLP